MESTKTYSFGTWYNPRINKDQSLLEYLIKNLRYMMPKDIPNKRMEIKILLIEREYELGELNES